jgi:REP element-mobilizing transposase RayT
MPNYRRAVVPGGCWFFTVNLLERRKTLLVDHIASLREAVAVTRQNHPFTIDAFVVLPDHLHAIWQLPPGDRDFSTRWRLAEDGGLRLRLQSALPATSSIFSKDLHQTRHPPGWEQLEIATPAPNLNILRSLDSVQLSASNARERKNRELLSIPHLTKCTIRPYRWKADDASR